MKSSLFNSSSARAKAIDTYNKTKTEQSKERKRLERERLEQERLERERLERERLEQERLEQEKQSKERLEQQQKELLDFKADFKDAYTKYRIKKENDFEQLRIERKKELFKSIESERVKREQQTEKALLDYLRTRPEIKRKYPNLQELLKDRKFRQEFLQENSVIQDVENELNEERRNSRRSPIRYNVFMKEQMATLRAEDEKKPPEQRRKSQEIFKEAVHMWGNSKAKYTYQQDEIIDETNHIYKEIDELLDAEIETINIKLQELLKGASKTNLEKLIKKKMDLEMKLKLLDFIDKNKKGFKSKSPPIIDLPIEDFKAKYK